MDVAKKTTEWTPDDKRGMPSPRRVLLLIGPIVVVWIVINVIAVLVQRGDFLEDMSVRIGATNVVTITNDLSLPQYFVLCNDETCTDIPLGKHIGDYPLTTPGHAQELHVPRATGDKSVSTYAVFNTNQDRQGCIHVILTKRRQASTEALLSQSIDDCTPVKLEQQNPENSQ